MKILLTAINSKYIHSNLAIFSLYAYAREYRENIKLKEFTINQTEEYILKGIYKEHPDVLMFSCYIWNISLVEELAEEFHRLRPEVPIWVGGPEVSYECAAFMNDHPWCTGIMTGEGEATFKEVVKSYCEGMSITDKRGMILRDGDGISFSDPRPPIDMNDIPFPYDDMEGLENRIIYYESSRGCPFSCSYCLSSVDKHLRFRDPETVKKELKFFMDRNVPLVKFVDRTFNCKKDHAMEIWRFIKENDNGLTCFHFEVSADLLDDEEIELIGSMREGLIQLEVGVQSTNEDTIREIHRIQNFEKLTEKVLKVQKVGNIHEHLDLIAGLPNEDILSFKKSFNDIYALKPDELQLGFLKVLKGSYMFEHAGEYGMVYRQKPPYEVLKTNWLSFDDVIELKGIEEMLEVYYNSGQYAVTVKILEKVHEDAFEMFKALSLFYEKKGYFDISHTRLKRAEIVLEYVKEALLIEDGPIRLPDRVNASDFIKLLKQALTYDLYARENCKTRPGWAPDESTFKRETRSFCKNGKLSHLEPFDYVFPDHSKRTIDGLPQREKEKVWMLFHYDERDILDHRAKEERVYITKDQSDLSDEHQQKE